MHCAAAVAAAAAAASVVADAAPPANLLADYSSESIATAMPLIGMAVLILVPMVVAMLGVMMMVVVMVVLVVVMMILQRLLREGKRKVTKRDLQQRVVWSCREPRRQQLHQRLPLRGLQQGEAA